MAPWESKRQQRWGHGKGGKKAGFTPEKIKEWDEKTDFESLPEEADQSNALTPEDETYREMSFPIAESLSWSIVESRPCGEGEDPKRGKCNPNIGPGAPYGPEEYRQDPEEWERETDKYHEDAARIERRHRQQESEEKLRRGQSETPYSKEPIPHPNDVGIDPAFRGGHGPLTAPQIDDINELDENLDSSQRLVDTAKRMGLHDENSDALMRQWQQENPGIDDQQTLIVMRDHYEKKIKKPGYEGAGTPVEDQPGFPPTKDPNEGAPWGASMSDIAAALDWSTHKSETFKDTGEKGLHPAWGLKSIIDRGVKTHEKSDGDKRIGEGEHQTQKRDIDGKSFKSYSMVHAFDWSL